MQFAMTEYKQITSRLTTAPTGMQKYNKVYTIHWVMHHSMYVPPCTCTLNLPTVMV